MEFSDGTVVTGDEVQFVEYIESGAYPYNAFQGINVQGKVDAYDIHNESMAE